VPRARRVAPEAQDVVDAERRGPEQVRLEADAIPVPRDHLHDGLDAFLQYDRGRGQGGNPNEGPLPIRHVACVDGPAIDGRMTSDLRRIRGRGRRDLGLHLERSYRVDALEMTACGDASART